MPKVHRSPPGPSKESTMQSTSEPELASTKINYGTPETTRNKRLRLNNSPIDSQSQSKLDDFKEELMQILSSWKHQQDQTLKNWKSELDTTLSTLVKDVNDLKNQCKEIRQTNGDIIKSIEFNGKCYEDKCYNGKCLRTDGVVFDFHKCSVKA
ncbi:unnamed protein product [Diatraea saccharalis]|uniref:Uncharacterized protein n=1 Tax=Diatraea saccharalis TaxID=40085 RepID=A0A9N9R5U2_9NEOP|nr:unnamed protein product [Diatraea saccharalis]